METKAFESFIGKCQHACTGIPGGKALVTPLYKTLTAAKNRNQDHVQFHPNSAQLNALKDLRTMFKLLSEHPVHCSQLVPQNPHYIGYCDACKHGAGGVWMSGTKTIRPIVWRIKWPPDIVKLTEKRPEEGGLTINDLEMAGVLIQNLILENLVPMKHTHAATWCDNTSAVAWTGRLNSSKSRVGQQLTRALALQMIINQSSHLAAMSIPGKDNDLADLASRSFKQTGVQGNYNLSDEAFLTKFNLDFPLTQDNSWLMLRLNTRLSSLVFTSLRDTPVPTGSWLRLTECGCDILPIGSTSAKSNGWTPFSEDLQTKCSLKPSLVSLSTSVKGMQDDEIKSGLAQFRRRWAPSPRPSRWTTGPTPPSTTG